MLWHLLEQAVFDGEALGERMGSICESLKLLFDEPDLQLPAVREPMQNTNRRWLATFQQKVPNRTFLLNALVGLVPPAGRAKFLVRMQDQDGPRCVCMQSDGAGKYNFFFGSELTTLPALSLFTAYDKAIDASDVVTFHVTDTDVHDATDFVRFAGVTGEMTPGDLSLSEKENIFMH